MTDSQRRSFLIRTLQREMPQYDNLQMPISAARQWQLLRSLMNARPPMPATEDFLTMQDALLQDMIRSKGITQADTLPCVPSDPRLVLWHGDITQLSCDAIVNAANSSMLGCFIPCHACIDNVIHTMSGVQLRLACNDLMEAQGTDEETGCAKITPGFNLPAKYVLHTVGPIVSGPLTEEHENLLTQCYRSCLDLAEENGLHSIAFCCISTGVFMFPNQRAAEIAVHTVKQWLDKTGSSMRVIFDVWKDDDLAIYRSLLQC